MAHQPPLKKGPLSSHSGIERESWLPPGKPTYFRWKKSCSSWGWQFIPLFSGFHTCVRTSLSKWLLWGQAFLTRRVWNPTHQICCFCELLGCVWMKHNLRFPIELVAAEVLQCLVIGFNAPFRLWVDKAHTAEAITHHQRCLLTAHSTRLHTWKDVVCLDNSSKFSRSYVGHLVFLRMSSINSSNGIPPIF